MYECDNISTFLQVDTPDSVLQSGLGLGPGPDTALRSMVDPRDYDRLRFFQMSAAQPNTFEETIHRVSQCFPAVSCIWENLFLLYITVAHKMKMFNIYTVFVTGLLENKYTIYIQHIICLSNNRRRKTFCYTLDGKITYILGRKYNCNSKI